MLAFIVVAGFGFDGWARARGGKYDLDSVYKTLQLFFGNFDLDSKTSKINPTLEWARIFAILITSWALIKLFSGSMFDGIRLYWQSWVRYHNRYVLLGFGELNRAFAQELSQRPDRPSITAVDRSFNEADMRIANDHGVLLIAGDLREKKTYTAAQVGESSRVIVATGDDTFNIEVATAAAEFVDKAQDLISGSRREEEGPKGRAYGCNGAGEPVVWVNVSDVRLLADLGEARDIAYSPGAAGQPFSIKTEIARDLIDRARFVQRARDHLQERVHLVLIGCGDQGEAILLESLMQSCAAGLKPPRITILDRNAEAVKARLHARRPRLFDGSIPEEARPCIEFRQIDDILSLDLSSGKKALTNIEDCEENGPTAWIICCRDDQVNLATGLRLELAMHQQARRPAPIYVRLFNAGIAGDSAEKRSPLMFVKVFGDVRRVAKRTDVLQDDADTLARYIDETYIAHFAERAPTAHDSLDPNFRMGWAKLPENVRDSNRSSARHARVKFADLGLRWRGMDSERLPWLEAEWSADVLAIIDSKIATKPEEQLSEKERRILQCYKAEHRRWLVDRALSGWRPAPEGEARDNRLRWHNKTASFDALTPNDKELDGLVVKALVKARLRASGGNKAYVEKIALIELTGTTAAPDPAEWQEANLDQATELRLIADNDGLARQLDAESKDGVIAEQTLSAAITRWARKDYAVRLHLVLRDPVEAPPNTRDTHKNAKASQYIDKLARKLNAGEADKIIFDVTRLYGRVDIR
ncbi:MAG: NAD-binding protein [Beijerinckiaceae bacterium]